MTGGWDGGETSNSKCSNSYFPCAFLREASPGFVLGPIQELRAGKGSDLARALGARERVSTEVPCPARVSVAKRMTTSSLPPLARLNHVSFST